MEQKKYHIFSDQKMILLIASLILLLLSFYPFNCWPGAFIAFIPLFFIVERSSCTETFLIAYILGLLFFFGTLYWIAQVSLFGCVFLISLYALFFAFYGLFIHFIVHDTNIIDHPLRSALLIACLWTALEIIRARMPVFGFGWILLASSQVKNILFIQIADAIGVYGVSFIIIFINALCFFSLRLFKEKRGRALRYGALAGAFLLFIYMYGMYRLSEQPEGKVVRIGIVQGNIAQEDKWNPQLKGSIIEIYRKLIEFISYQGPDVIFLPEAAYPGNLVKEYPLSTWRNTVMQKRIPVVVGAVRVDNRGDFKEYNSAFLLSGGGEIERFYDKIKLVPFGEYIPIKHFFSWCGLTKLAYSLGVGDFTQGDAFTVFKQSLRDARESFSFGTLICFEDIFPELSRQFVARGARMLAVLTNDAWFGDTAAPYQHLHASIFRAIENRVPVIRSANTGISAIISSHGRILNSVKDPAGHMTFVVGGVVQPIFLGSEQTIYGKYGFYIDTVFITIFYCFLFFLAFSIAKRKWVA